MKQIWFILLVPMLLSCVDKKDFQILVQSGRDGNETVYVSDPSVTITVTWKSYRPTGGKATLLDPDHNPVMTCDVPTQWDDPANEKRSVVIYVFTPQDKPGSWSIAMSFDGEEIVYHGFTVLPPIENPEVYTEDSEAYKSLPCLTTDGRPALDNIYQVSDLESTLLNGFRFSVTDVIDQLKKRSYVCISGATLPDSWDDWERWFEQVSGKKVRQRHPVVHERIAAVMPVYEEEFLFVNPEFVQWFSQTMIPDPNETPVNGPIYQQIYDNTVRYAARRMALTFLYYNSLPDSGLDAQVEYAQLAATKYVNSEEDRVMQRNDRFSVYEYIDAQYAAPSAEWAASQFGKEVISGDPFNIVGEDMSFWLRRGIDGSVDELWMALSDVLKKYDTHWYNQIIAPNWGP